MKVLKMRNIKKRIPNASVAFGFFDGVHLGHQEILRHMLNGAPDTKVVLTFDKHPRDVIFGVHKVKYITTKKQKEEILATMGVEYLLYIDFDTKIMNMEPMHFVNEYLLQKIDIKKMTVGFNNRFGKKGMGDTALLRQIGTEKGFDVEVIAPVKLGEQVISSTAIRQAIEKGDIELANQMLGREFSLCSKVIDGKHLGRKLGFPTANMQMPQKLIMPQNGVYLTKAYIDGEEHFALTNVGINPTFVNHPYRIETHILNFDQDIYGNLLQICFLKKIRDEKNFENLDELQKQLYNDTDYAKKYIENTKSSDGSVIR